MKLFFCTALGALCQLTFACGQDASVDPTLPSGELPPGIVARVGDDEIHADTVAAIAREQSISRRRALDLAIQDALFALELRNRPGTSHLVGVAERGALARSLLEQLRAQAAKRGPPNSKEVETVVKRHWYDIDRPAGARTIHVIALAKRPEDRTQARALARRLAQAVRGLKTDEAFEAAAKKVEAGEIEVKVERLPPVARDGRVIPGKPPIPGAPIGRVETPFSEAANDLAEPGDQSGVIETTHGFHVIMMLERVPAVRLAEDVRTKTVSREVLSDRARALESEVLRDMSAENDVTHDRAAQELTARVRVTP